MATYKPYRKTASGKEEVKVPSSSVSGLATVATSGSYNDLADKPSIPDVSGKANLEGGNSWKGDQYFVNRIYSQSDVETNSLRVTDDGFGGDDFFGASYRNGNPYVYLGGAAGDCTLTLNGDEGTSGQVLTSQGAGKTPIWADVTKHGYTELTNKDLNTITEVGWYRAASGNTCTNRPTNVGTSPFILEVEKCTSTEIRQTLYTRYWTNGFYIRTSTNSGSSWTSWQSQYTVDTGAQVFSGRKSFSGGINLTSSLQVSGSSGTAGQVLTSTGTGTPQWKTPTSGGGGNSSVTNTYIEGEGDDYTLFGSTETGICEVFGTINCSGAQEEDYSIEIETDSGNGIAYVADVFHGDMDGLGRVYFYAKIIRLLDYGTTYTQTTFRHVSSDTAGTVTEQTNINGTENAGDIYIYFGASASYTMKMVIVKTATEV